MRKIMTAASGTSTTTNANSIKSFNMSRFSSKGPRSNRQASPQRLLFKHLH